MQKNFQGDGMLNKFVIFLFLFICITLSINTVAAEEMYLSSEKKNKFNLSICAIFKNEAKYLKEWIEYHRLLGVDHFYLYNIGSRDYFQLTLRPYIRDGIVTLINWPEALSDQDESNADKWALSTQIPAYENAINFIARNETKWLAIIGIDEFLVCPKGNIKDLLKKYDQCPSISLSSDFFESAFEAFPKKPLVIQSLDLTSPPTSNINKSVEKMIFKPDLCLGFFWPPYRCRFKNSESGIVMNREELRINHYMNRTGHPSFKKKRAYRKDFNDRKLSQAEISKLLEEGYLIEDQEQSIHKYIPELLKRLEQKSEWNS